MIALFNAHSCPSSFSSLALQGKLGVGIFNPHLQVSLSSANLLQFLHFNSHLTSLSSANLLQFLHFNSILASLSSANLLQFLHFNSLLASLSTASNHLPLGLPIGLLPEFRVIVSRIMRWTWHVSCMGEKRGV